MTHILFLISLFSQINSPIDSKPQDLVGADTQIQGVDKDSAFIEVRFNKTPQVTVGDPVLFNGSVVGSISRVDQPATDKGATNISIRLSQDEVPVTESLVALVGSVKMGVSLHSSKKGMPSSHRNFLELMSFNPGVHGDSSYVKGFTSFQEFWASQSSI